MLRTELLSLLEVHDQVEFRSKLISYARLSGFNTMSATTVVDYEDRNSSFITLDNIPDSYREGFENISAGRRDPVMQHCKYSSLPLIWTRSTYIRAKQLDLWEEQAPHGLVTGIALALHLPGRRHFFIGLDRDQLLPVQPSEVTRMVADLQLFAVFAQEAACKIVLPVLEAERPRLTERELECLRWTMEGKTAWELGRILGISEHTAVRHIFNASRKLGCGGKHQAVLKAMRLQLIR